MGASYVQLPADGAGKKLQTWENVIGANTVHTEGVCITDTLGAEKTIALEGGNLAVIAGDTTSLDGKVTACDTGAVTVAASALPAGAATQATLATIDADTGSIATDAGTIAGDTTSIDGKITACDTGAIAGAVTVTNATAANLKCQTSWEATTYKYIYTNIQADGDIIALVAGKKIRVHAMVIHAIDTSSGTIETNAGAGAIFLKWSLAAREGMVLPFNPAGWFETAAGEALYADFVVGAETMFTIVYSEV